MNIDDKVLKVKETSLYNNKLDQKSVTLHKDNFDWLMEQTMKAVQLEKENKRLQNLNAVAIHLMTNKQLSKYIQKTKIVK